MLIDIIKSRVIQLVTVALMIHFVTLLSPLPREFLNAFATALSLTLAMAVMVVYLPVAWTSILSRKLGSRDRIAWGIVFSWFSRFVLSAVTLVGTISGEGNSDFRATPWFGLVFIIIALAATFHITAPHQEDIRPHYNWPLLLLAIGSGCLICGVIIGFALSAAEV